MPKYLFHANYVGDGIKGLLADGGSRRRSEVEALLKSVGGKLESFYYAFGPTDAYVIVELPDHKTASALALTVGASGRAKVVTTVLMTPEEIDAASEISPSYRPPGG